MKAIRSLIVFSIILLGSTCTWQFPNKLDYAELWYLPVPSGALINYYAVYDNGFLYTPEVGSYEGIFDPDLGAYVHKFDLDKNIEWTIDVDASVQEVVANLSNTAIITAIACIDDQVIITTTEGNPWIMEDRHPELIAYSKETGEYRWHYQLESFDGNPEAEIFAYGGYIIAVSDGCDAQPDPVRTSIHVLSHDGELVLRRNYPFRTKTFGKNYHWG